jgi:hypothetical protein
MMDQLVGAAADVLAARAGMNPDDPEPQIAATALLGLWKIQLSGWGKYLDGTRTPAQVRQAITADVHTAAHVIDSGLSTFAATTPDPDRPPAATKQRRKPTKGAAPDAAPEGPAPAAKTRTTRPRTRR